MRNCNDNNSGKSRKLAFLLRHDNKAFEERKIDEYGWRRVDELLDLGFTRPLLEEIVESNNKKRYEFNTDKTKIRARQGHSIPVDVELENRIPPKYTISGRGVNHTQSELETAKQVMADVDILVMDGIRLISGQKRPNHDSAYTSDAEIISGKYPYFFFPIFSGSVYDGTTFEALANAKITINYKGRPAKMLDSTWSNPCSTFKATEGGYSFCVEPEKAKKEGMSKDFSFELTISAPGYDTINYAFTVPVASKILKGSAARPNYSLKITDLFLFPQGMVNPMERYPVSGD